MPKLRLPNQRSDDEDHDSLDDIPRVRWETVKAEFVDKFEQGQHWTVLGKTDSGKSTVVLDALQSLIVDRNAHVIALGIKARDKTLRRTHWPLVRDWPPTYAQRHEPGKGIVFWPPYSKPSRARITTRPRVEEMLDEVMAEGGWRLFVDEVAYLIETLGLRQNLDEFWNGARSSGISLIGGTQRPRIVPRSAVSQMDWVTCFRINDTDDRKRAAEILGDRDRFYPAIGKLNFKKHEFLLVNTRTDQAVISRLEKLPTFT
jgi:hypothetical protein